MIVTSLTRHTESGRFLQLVSVFSAGLMVALTLAWYGSGPDGVGVAMRNSARFSSVVFAVALAARVGLRAVGWMHAFVVAHVVHYATVSYAAVTNVHHHLHSIDARNAVVIVFGVLLLLVLASTSSSRRTLWRRVNAVAVFIVGAVFAGSAVLNAARSRAAVIPAVAVLVGLTIHLYRRYLRSRAR